VLVILLCILLHKEPNIVKYNQLLREILNFTFLAVILKFKNYIFADIPLLLRTRTLDNKNGRDFVFRQSGLLLWLCCLFSVLFSLPLLQELYLVQVQIRLTSYIRHSQFKGVILARSASCIWYCLY
jgi:hypothetical protein